MKKKYNFKQPLTFILLGLFFIIAISWQNNPIKNTKTTTNDTLPERNKKIRDIDDAIDELDKSKNEIDKDLKEIDWNKINMEIRDEINNIKIDNKKINEEVKSAMKDFDERKIQAEINKELKDIDFEKINEKVQLELKNIDVDKIRKEVSDELKNISTEQITANVNAALANIDWNKMNSEFDKLKNIDLPQLEHMKPEIEKEIGKAHENIDKARVELKFYKKLIDKLNEDGLIDKKTEYVIEYKNGQLILNGKNQPDNILKKYDSLLNNHKNFIIKKSDDNFNINNED